MPWQRVTATPDGWESGTENLVKGAGVQYPVHPDIDLLNGGPGDKRDHLGGRGPDLATLGIVASQARLLLLSGRPQPVFQP